MMGKGFLGIRTRVWLALLAFAAGASGNLVAAEIRDVRVAATETGTRVVLDLSAPVKHKAFLLDAPGRVVLDVSKSSLKSALPAAEGVVTDGALGQVAERRPAARVRGHRARHDPDTRRSLQAPTRVTGWCSTSRVSRRARPRPSRWSATPAAPAVPVAIRPAHAPLDSGRDIVIAIDAGHGGVDPGASGKRGTREKDVVLAIAKALAARINSEPGMKAVLTRDGDYFISLRERNTRARRAKADLFVSIHADAIANPGRVRFLGIRAVRSRRVERGCALARRA